MTTFWKILPGCKEDVGMSENLCSLPNSSLEEVGSNTLVNWLIDPG